MNSAYDDYCSHNQSIEYSQIDGRIEILLPKDKKRFKKLFRIHESQYNEYKKITRQLLEMMNPTLTWDDKTKNIVLRELGEIKGLNILTILSSFMEDYDWKEYTKDHKNLVETIVNRYIGIDMIRKYIGNDVIANFSM